jgi:hypothetical protein
LAKQRFDGHDEVALEGEDSQLVNASTPSIRFKKEPNEKY